MNDAGAYMMAQQIEAEGSLEKSVQMTYIVFGRASKTIDDAVKVYKNLDAEDRRRILIDSAAAAKDYVDSMLGKGADGEVPTGLYRQVKEVDLCDKLLAIDAGDALLRTALEQMESRVRRDARYESHRSIAVMPEECFVGNSAGYPDVIGAVLKIVSDANQFLNTKSDLRRRQGEYDVARELALQAIEVLKVENAILDWISTPCPDDCDMANHAPKHQKAFGATKGMEETGD